jgi:hypothetical protein
LKDFGGVSPGFWWRFVKGLITSTAPILLDNHHQLSLDFHRL